MYGEIKETRRIIIDGELISSKDDFYYTIKGQIGEGFILAPNLDSLHDVLTSISCSTEIVIKRQNRLSYVLGGYWDDIYEVITDSLDENYNLSIDVSHDSDF